MKHKHLEASVDRDRDVRRELERLYARYVELLYSRNIPAILEMLTPDYRLECADGTTMDLSETEKLLEEQCNSLEPDTTLQIDIESIGFLPDAAAATVTEKTVAVDAPASEQCADDRAADRLLETWVFTGETWKISRTTVLQEEVRIAA